jgi:uncharacterized protein
LGAHAEQVIALSNNSGESRYEIHVDGILVGHCRYERREDRIIFPHTEVDPAFEGRGIGGQLVAFVLDDARSRNLRVVPECSFIEAYIRSHPEYADLVAHPP